MSSATLLLHGNLADFVSPSRRGTELLLPFSGTAAVKDVVEAAGVPHPEIDFLLVDGAAVALGQRISGQVRVEVFPFGLAPVPLPAIRAGAPFPEPRRFVLDVHLGTLAGNLRMLGFDTVWSNDADDPELARVAAEETRILLTRDLGLLKRSEVLHGYFPRATDPAEQVVEISSRFGLPPRALPFSRCLKCNGLLAAVEKSAVMDLLPPRVRESQTEFRRCAGCHRVYWKGTHHSEMVERISRLLSDGASS